MSAAGPLVRIEAIAGELKGKRWKVGAGAVRVGRAETCDIVLSDPKASRQHTELRATANGLVVRDLGSTNRTRVNGEEVGETTALDGDVIQIGRTQLRVTMPAAVSAKAPAAASAPPPRPKRPAREAELEVEYAAEAAGTMTAPKTGSRGSRVRVLVVALMVAVLGFAAVILLTSGGEDSGGFVDDPGREERSPGGGGGSSDRSGSDTGGGDAGAEGSTPGVVMAPSEDAKDLYEEGVTLFQYGRLVEARRTLENALIEAPGWVEVQDALDRTNLAIDLRIDNGLERAVAEIEALRYDAALRTLDEVFYLMSENHPRRTDAEKLRARIQ